MGVVGGIQDFDKGTGQQQRLCRRVEAHWFKSVTNCELVQHAYSYLGPCDHHVCNASNL